MNKNKIKKLITGFSLTILTACLPSPAISQEGGLIIPMPGTKQIDKAKEELKKKNNPESQNSGTSQSSKNNSGTLIPLPNKIKRPPKQAPKPEKNNNEPDETPNVLIKIPERPEPGENNTSQDFPQIPDEVIVEPDSLTPPVDLPSDKTSTVDSATEEYPLFPKDTSSAVFMVMKTWQCEDYDGNTLLSHAVEVYSQEAGESFQIKGLDPQQAFLLNLDEEDITLDELLDFIALKTGRDWGADVPGRTIYFYPKGIKTDGVGSW
jgi:hypothetical protein